jgi:ribosomal protein S18 acetylase RimI-like enzyme
MDGFSKTNFSAKNEMNRIKMNIRLATEKDSTQIALINIENWKSTYIKILPPDYLDSLTQKESEIKWIQFLKRADTFIYVAEDNDKIYGYAASQYKLNKPGTGLLYSLHTVANARGKGIGKKLMAASAGHFKQNGVHKLTVWVMEGNDEALAIYKHLGAEVYIHETHQFGPVAVAEIGLVWKDINSVCSL